MVQSGSSNGGTTTAPSQRVASRPGGAALDDFRHDLEDAAAALVGTVALALVVLFLPVRCAVRFRPGDALRYA